MRCRQAKEMHVFYISLKEFQITTEKFDTFVTDDFNSNLERSFVLLNIEAILKL